MVVKAKEVFSIKDEYDVREFYNNNLIYDRSNESSKHEVLKKITVKESRHLYSTLYVSSIRSQARKVDLLRAIEMYFDGIDRALAMKP